MPNSDNPLLEYQPAYTYSMPTQLLILGIVLTLLTVLLFHLLFTAKYHYPLARSNFILLLSAVILTEISTIIFVILTNIYLFDRSRSWPFMFDYIEVSMPRSDWNVLPLAAWYIMQGAVTFLAHATHIQFLTLLFPSSLERKLILAFLGPLCVFASVLFFTHFLSDPNYQDLGDAIRNTATSTLSLLYTFGLLIWGYVVNRKRAWEHEGGTFGFGAISISLALIGTAANFIEVREDRLKWLPWLVNTVLLWQSWAGFWWWVGAGMWLGEVEDIERREEKKKRREEKRQRKRYKMLNLISNLSQPVPRDTASTTARKSIAEDEDDPTVNLTRSNSRLGASCSGLSTSFRRHPSELERYRSHQGDSQIELEILGPPLNQSTRSPTAETNFRSPLTEASSSVIDDPLSTHRHGIFSFLQQPVFLQRWLGTLYRAHNEAAKYQARTAGGIKQTEQVKRFGLRAMTQRIAFQTFSHQQNLAARLGSPTNPSHPSADHRPACRQHGPQPHQSDSDNWVSDDEPACERAGRASPAPRPPNRASHAGGSGPQGRPGLRHRDNPFAGPQASARSPGQPTADRPTSSPASSVHHRPPQPLPCHTLPAPDGSSAPCLHLPSHTPLQPQPPIIHSTSWNWKCPLAKARLKDVTRYDH